GRLANEYLAAIKTVWTHDVASFDGQFVSFKDVHTAPRPVRSAHPPIWVGGSSEGALKRAVCYGDAWHPLQIRMAWLRDQALPRHRQWKAGSDAAPRVRLGDARDAGRQGHRPAKSDIAVTRWVRSSGFSLLGCNAT